MEILKIYKYALQREYEGKNFFEQNASRMSHASAVEVFKRLAEEEQRHINFIVAQIDVLQDPHLSEKPGEVEIPEAGFFSQRAQSEMIDQTVAEAMVPDLPVLRMAYLIERDFAEFYEMAASQTSGKAKEALGLLAGWERVHERLFKQMHDKAFEQYAQMPWGG
jgi:rubrerythrin